MYIVWLDHLPEQKRTDEAVVLMAETLSWAMETPYIEGLNFAVRAAQHARADKIAKDSARLQIPIKSKQGRNLAENTAYKVFGGKRAPWLENKIKPPRYRR